MIFWIDHSDREYIKRVNPLRIQGHRGVYLSAYNKDTQRWPCLRRGSTLFIKNRVPKFLYPDYAEPHFAQIHIAGSAYAGYTGSETLRKLNILGHRRVITPLNIRTLREKIKSLTIFRFQLGLSYVKKLETISCLCTLKGVVLYQVT